ncbi:MAG: acetylxylan esterase [Chloroflexota bacterium]|nr:acetylxylan esterase [Chloroflexota bacterium]
MTTNPHTEVPTDFDAFWDGIDADLAAVPAAPEAEASALHSTEFSTTYKVRLTSIGPYRFEVFLSIPDGEGPFPALMLAPGYASVVTPPSYDDRLRYVAMSIRYRGTRGADKPYAAKFPGLLTDGIEAPDRWMFRGIFADTLRAFEYLTGLPMVDPGRVAINGSDLGVIVAARRPGVTALSVTVPFFYRLVELYPQTEAYPFEEINDHLRMFPEHREAANLTLSYVDPLHHAGRVTADTFVAVGDPGAIGGPEWMAPQVRALGGAVEQYPVTHEGQTDYDAVDRWLAQRQGVEPRPRTWQPQDIGPWSARRE